MWTEQWLDARTPTIRLAVEGGGQVKAELVSGRHAELLRTGIRTLVVVFLYGLVLVRFTGQRACSKLTAFDIVLVVLSRSNLSRAFTGNAPLFPTLAATTAMVVVHWVLASARKGLGNWFRRRCRGVGLPHCSAHGLR